MDIYMTGAENPTYMRELTGLGVTHIGISYYEWQRRHASDELSKIVPDEISVVVTAGVSRKDIDFRSFSKDYLDFAEHNYERALIYDMDAPLCPIGIRKQTRKLLDILPNTVIFPLEGEELHEVAAQYERIGLNARITKSTPVNELRRLQATLYGSNVADYRVLLGGRFSATTTMQWLGGRRYGALWVYARGKMHHYDAENLVKAVRAHSEDLRALGVDPKDCAANDKHALTIAAVRSLQAMGEALSKRPRDRVAHEVAAMSENGDPVESVDEFPSDSATPSRNLELAPLNTRERITLPVLNVTTHDEVRKLASVTTSMRMCDSCYLSEVCPQFKPQTTCAFDLPIEIANDVQRRAASQVIVEWQFGRVAFGVLAEQMDGGGLTARVGQEMDRYHKLLAQIKDLEVPTGPAIGDGPLSSIFGVAPQLGVGSDDDTEEEAEEEDEERAIDAWITNEQESEQARSGAQ